jgi:hypothetical protein
VNTRCSHLRNWRQQEPSNQGDTDSNWESPIYRGKQFLHAKTGQLSRYSDGLWAGIRFPAVQEFSPQRSDRLWGPLSLVSGG